jgi:hypothetical protein
MRGAVAVAVGLWAGSSLAAGEASNTEEHRALVISAQVMQKEGKLLRARELLATCSSKACADDAQANECEEIRAFCTQRLASVVADIPTANVRVEDDRGLPVRPEVLEVDTVTLDPSKPLALDPGAHVAKALYVGRVGEASFVLERGKQNVSVLVHVDLRETVHRRPVPLPVYLLGATTIASGLLSLATGIYTVSSYQALSSCKPYCGTSQQGTLEATSYVADISAIVAITSAVASAIWFFARPTVSEVRWLHATTERTR